MERGIPIAQTGLLHAVFWISMSVLQIPTGLIADRIGRKKAYLIATTVGCAGACLYWRSYTLTGMVTGQLLSATCRSFFDGAIQSWAVDRLHRRDTESLMRIANIEQQAFGGAATVTAFASG